MTAAPRNSGQMQGDLFDADPMAVTTSPPKKLKANKSMRLQKPLIATRFLSIDEVAKRYGVGPSTIWRWVKENDHFPQPIKLSPGTSRWSEVQLLEFEEDAFFRASKNESKTGRPLTVSMGKSSK